MGKCGNYHGFIILSRRICRKVPSRFTFSQMSLQTARTPSNRLAKALDSLIDVGERDFHKEIVAQSHKWAKIISHPANKEIGGTRCTMLK